MKAFTVGQVAKRAGVGVETVRFYERQGLLDEPERKASGYRQYGADDVAVLRFIRRAKQLGFTLKEIKALLALRLDGSANRLLIDAYGLQSELMPGVQDQHITHYRPDRSEDMKRLLSYIVGCAMGRYSLDKPGLIYAHAGNADFDPSQYTTFPADVDGIIPLSEIDWGIADDAVNRVVEFVGTVWPKDSLEDNLRFLANSLDAKKNEPARDTIRRYLATEFYDHHLRSKPVKRAEGGTLPPMYRNRPIYWLFSSGKQRAFQALVYLHRYHEGTLARMRTDYLIPLQSKVVARIDQLDGDIAQATSTTHRRKLQKEQDELKKQRTELTAYDEKLRHAADQRITLDLDDGVKMNYAKFGDLLAEVKAVYATAQFSRYRDVESFLEEQLADKKAVEAKAVEQKAAEPKTAKPKATGGTPS